MPSRVGAVKRSVGKRDGKPAAISILASLLVRSHITHPEQVLTPQLARETPGLGRTMSSTSLLIFSLRPAHAGQNRPRTWASSRNRDLAEFLRECRNRKIKVMSVTAGVRKPFRFPPSMDFAIG